MKPLPAVRELGSVDIVSRGTNSQQLLFERRLLAHVNQGPTLPRIGGNSSSASRLCPASLASISARNRVSYRSSKSAGSNFATVS